MKPWFLVEGRLHRLLGGDAAAASAAAVGGAQVSTARCALWKTLGTANRLLFGVFFLLPKLRSWKILELFVGSEISLCFA